MAKIVDPDDITPGSEVVIDPTGKTITLVITGNLSTDGMNLNCLYSYLKIRWKNDTDLIKFAFPMISITSEQFELINGWDFGDTTTRELIRDGGWSLKDTGGTTQETYMNLTSLGSFNDSANDRAYYLQSITGTPTDMVYAGEVNQAIKIYGDATHGDFDYTTFFQIFLREQGKTYGFYDLIDEQNLTLLENKKYALPLTNASDLKITHEDSTITGTTPYTGMSITYLDGDLFIYITGQSSYVTDNVVQDDSGRWYICTSSGTVVEDTISGNTGTATWTPFTGERQIGSSYYPFSIIIDGNSGTAEQIYEFVQYQLRQPTDIDDGAGTVRGDIAEELLAFIGDTLQTQYTTIGGTYIDNFLANDTNRLQFYDSTNVQRTFPYVAAGTIFFNDNLQNDADAVYRVFFTNDNAGDNLGYDFGTLNAITIQDNSDVDIAGGVSGNTSIAFDYDYDGNTQRGAASAGEDAPYTAVAIGLGTAQYVVTTGTITRSTSNSINFVAALERNYTNP